MTKSEGITIDQARQILNCPGCANLPTHPLDTRACCVASETQIIYAASVKGKCRKRSEYPSGTQAG